MRERVRAVVDAPLFQKVITGVILLNAVTLGCETSPALIAEYGGLLPGAWSEVARGGDERGGAR